MATPDRHLDRAQLYLRFALEHFLDEQYYRAAKALCRSATHAASAILAKQGRPTRTRRRMQDAVGELVFEGRLRHAHLLTFRRVHDLPRRLSNASPAESSHLVRTMRLRVNRMVRDVAQALNDGKSWEAFEETGILRLFSNLPQLSEMHATIPARCNNLSLPPVRPPDMQLAYNPEVCPKCANLPARHVPRDQRPHIPVTMNPP